MMRRMTEDEAFEAAMQAGGIRTDGHVDITKDPHRDFFANVLVRGDTTSPAFAAICVYFAVRGGAVVMREETAAERKSRHDESDSVNYG